MTEGERGRSARAAWSLVLWFWRKGGREGKEGEEEKNEEEVEMLGMKRQTRLHEKGFNQQVLTRQGYTHGLVGQTRRKTAGGDETQTRYFTDK